MAREKLSNLPTSSYLQVEQIAEGVYAALGLGGGGGFSNAGIVDLGDRTLIFDTFANYHAGQDLCQVARQLTGHPAAWIVISHWHADHWMGNQVFARSAMILATHRAYQQMAGMAAEIERLKADPSEYDAWGQGLQDQLAHESDPQRCLQLENAIARWEVERDELPSLEPRLPDQTFGGKLVFHGSRRRAELIASGSGHTSGDCYLRLPEEKIIFLGDLGFFRAQPFMPGCNPEGWMKKLERLEQSDYQVFMPGHGPLGTKIDLALQRQFITWLQKTVRAAVEKNQTVETILKRPLPKAFATWDKGLTRFESNVKFLYKRYS